MTEMHDVVEMILNRMKDYPEDFFSVPNPNTYDDSRASKWYRAAQMISGVVTDEEKDALHAATLEAKRAVYMGAALKTILSDEEPEEEKFMMKTSNRYAGFGSAPVKAEGSTIGYNTMANTITIGSAQLTEDKVNMITELQAKQKAMEAQMAADKYAIRQEYEKAYATNHA